MVDMYTDCQARWEQHGGPDCHNALMCHFKIVFCLFNAKEVGKAVPHLRAAYEELSQLGDRSTCEAYKAANKLAQCLSILGKTEEAWDYSGVSCFPKRSSLLWST